MDVKPAGHSHHSHDHSQAGRETHPVCGMKVDPSSAAGSAEHRGKKYYFCGKYCLAKFTADPGRYMFGMTEPDWRVLNGSVLISQSVSCSRPIDACEDGHNDQPFMASGYQMFETAPKYPPPGCLSL